MAIRINYDQLEDEVIYLKSRKMELKNLLVVVENIGKSISESNSGEAINTLLNKLSNYEKNITKAMDGVQVLIRTIEDYSFEMDQYVKATTRTVTVTVDASDVLKNIEDIERDSVKDGWFSDGNLQNAKDVLKEDPFSMDYDPTEYNEGVYRNNKRILEESAELIENSKNVFYENIEAMRSEQRKLQDFEDCDTEYANLLKNRLEDLDLSKAYSKESKAIKNINEFSATSLKLNISREEEKKIEAQMNKQIMEFKALGWSNAQIAKYMDEVYKKIQPNHTYEEIMTVLRKANADAKTIGSDLFVAMFDAEPLNENSATRKLKILKSYYECGYKMAEGLKESDPFYKSVNDAVIASKVFKEIGPAPTEFQYFISTTLNQLLNNSIISAESYKGKEGLSAMFNEGWQISGYDKKDEDFGETLRTSRYHAIGNPITLPNGAIYDPRYNIKILSPDKKFERIYNTELGLFLDEIYTTYPDVKNQAGGSTNIATYNYGYKNKTGADYEHVDVDVNTYNAWGNDYTNKGIELSGDDVASYGSKKDYIDYLNEPNEPSANHTDIKNSMNKDGGMIGILKASQK